MTDLTPDEVRLLWLVMEAGLEDINGVDLHAAAAEHMDARDETPGDHAYLAAIREAVDKGVKADWPDAQLNNHTGDSHD